MNLNHYEMKLPFQTSPFSLDWLANYVDWMFIYVFFLPLKLCFKVFPKLFHGICSNFASLRKHPFLLALRRWGRFARRNVCDSATKIPYWRRKSMLNKSGGHGVPNANLFNFTFLLVDFGKVLCSSANELQQNSNACCREDYIPQILIVLLEIHRVYIWPLWPFVFCLPFLSNS